MEQCVYCGLAAGETRDHVPPKNLLKKPFRPNLRTVPACGACNRSFSQAEEYFRRILIMLFAHTQEGDEFFDSSVGRSLDRSPMIEQSVWDSLGVENGRCYTELDTDAIRQVAEKIVKGLSYLRSARRVDPKGGFGLALYEPVNRPPAVAVALAAAPVDSADGPNFTFRVVDNPDREHAEFWELCFFDSFCCAVGVRK